jgi:hypothetical protein
MAAATAGEAGAAVTATALKPQTACRGRRSPDNAARRSAEVLRRSSGCLDVHEAAPEHKFPRPLLVQRVAVERRRLTAADLLAFSCARSLNLAKYSASVSGRIPGLVGTHSRGVVGIRRISLRSSQGAMRPRRSRRTTIKRRILSNRYILRMPNTTRGCTSICWRLSRQQPAMRQEY